MQIVQVLKGKTCILFTTQPQTQIEIKKMKWNLSIWATLMRSNSDSISPAAYTWSSIGASLNISLSWKAKGNPPPTTKKWLLVAGEMAFSNDFFLKNFLLLKTKYMKHLAVGKNCQYVCIKKKRTISTIDRLTKMSSLININNNQHQSKPSNKKVQPHKLVLRESMSLPFRTQ